MASSEWHAKRASLVVALRRAGYTYRRIARITGYTHASIYRILSESNMVTPNSERDDFISPIIREAIREAYRNGTRIPELHDLFRVSSRTLQEIINEQPS